MDTGNHLWNALAIKRVREASMKQFINIKNVSAKVNFVEKLLVKYYSKALDAATTSELQIKKNNEKSDNFKQKGNALFFQKNYYAAFELYNKCISFAEMDSENLSIGYANRSAVLFQWKLYKECMENIKLAKNVAKYPEKLTTKLNKREKCCLDLLSTQEKPITKSFDFSFNPHPVVSEIADCIHIKYTKTGRGFLFTDRALKVGECILIEEPLLVVSLPNANYQRCANCNTENFVLMPCPNCTCTMFCSEKCLTEAECFHKFECPIIDFLNSKFKDQHLLALRISLKGFHSFRSLDKLKKFYDNSQNQNQNLFTSDKKHSNTKIYFRSICALHTNEKKMPVKEQYLHAVDIAVLRYYLLTKTPLKDILAGDNNSSKIFTEIFYRNLMVSIDNKISLASHADDGELFASSIPYFMTYIRHSCTPNTFSCHKGTKIYTFVLRPIPANGEIFSKYKEVHYGNRPKPKRQIELKNDFYFSCKCDACNANYPLFTQLNLSEYVPSVPELSKADLDITFADAEKMFPEYCGFLEKYDNHYPCLQMCTTETRLLECFNILLRAGSLKAKFKNQKSD